jgi:hypothetical protein
VEALLIKGPGPCVGILGLITFRGAGKVDSEPAPHEELFGERSSTFQHSLLPSTELISKLVIRIQLVFASSSVRTFDKYHDVDDVSGLASL